MRRHFFCHLDELEAAGIPAVRIMFGFAWGNYVYEGPWKEEICSPSEIRARIEKLENEKLGRIGDDDFYISVPGSNLERLYCHEADIHYSSDESAAEIQKAKNEWLSLGWKIYE